MATAEETVIANAVEALGKNMQQEATDEFICRDGHGLLPIVISIVSPEESDHAICDVEQTIVRDGDAVRVASDVLQNLLWPGEWRFGIDHPCDRRSPGKENGNVT